MPVELDDFKLFSSALELRYADHFLIWDKAGSFWDAFSEKFSPLSVKQAEPSGVTVKFDRHTEASVGVNRATIVAQQPGTDLERLKTIAEVFVPALTRELKILQFSRVGMRLLYERVFPSREDAANYISMNVAIPRLSGRIMNTEGKLLDPELAMRWESDKTGFLMRISARQQKLDFTLPPEYADNAFPGLVPIRNQVLIDIDYYIHSITSAGQINAGELIENWRRVIRRDIGKVMHE